MTEIKASFWQSNISPFTNVYSVIRGINRRRLADGLMMTAGKLNTRQNDILREVFVRHGLVLKGSAAISPEDWRYFNFSNAVTAKRLILAAKEFSNQTGLNEFSVEVVPGIIKGTPVDRIKFDPQTEARDSNLDPNIYNLAQENNLFKRLKEQALDFAVANQILSRNELTYRLKKMGEIERNNVLAIVASLFMEVPAERLEQLLANATGDRLLEFKEEICVTVSELKQLKDKFVFEPEQIFTDKKYLYYKMIELVSLAEEPEVLLLYFMDKLAAAREAKNKSDKIFDEIRYLLAPLAERLGLIFLADDFRDQWLRLKVPFGYKQIETDVCFRLGADDYRDAKRKFRKYTEKLRAFLIGKLPSGHAPITFFRVKSPYSVFNKVFIRQECKLREIRDHRGFKGICSSEEDMYQLHSSLLQPNEWITVDLDSIKMATEKNLQEDKWRGIKMVGIAKDGALVEIQLMTEEMNYDNMFGRVAGWLYNLKKELGSIPYEFGKMEKKETFSPHYTVNFNNVKNLRKVTRQIKISA